MFNVILVKLDVINLAIGKIIACCFSITFIWLTSQTSYSRFYGPASDVIWVTYKAAACAN